MATVILLANNLQTKKGGNSNSIFGILKHFWHWATYHGLDVCVSCMAHTWSKHGKEKKRKTT